MAEMKTDWEIAQSVTPTPILEIARERRTHVESAFLAALMHRTGAALSLKILSRFEAEQRTVMDARSFADLVAEYEPAFGRLFSKSASTMP